MKLLLLRKLTLFFWFCCVLGLTPAVQAFDHTHAAFDVLLKASVIDGLVNYASLKTDPTALDHYLASLAAIPAAEFTAYSKNQRLALLINLYNAATLKLIVVHYPVASIREIKGPDNSPWKCPDISFLGKKISLDTLENEIIRPQYQEPRIHFSLVCAALSCPPLRSEAYTDANLNSQLNDQITRFLATKSANRLEGHTLYLSPIFDWYAADFMASAGSVPAFVAPFFPESDRSAILNKPSVKFTDYNWSLNQP